MENQDPPRPNDFWGRRRWLGRLTFTFLILAVYLAYSGYRGAEDHALSRVRVILLYVAAMLAFVLFVMGTRERHRSHDDEDLR